MIKGLLFHWEENDKDIYSGIDSIGGAWLDLAYTFNIKLSVIESIPFNNGREDIFRYKTFIDFIEKNPDENLILLCPHSKNETININYDYWLCVGPANGWGENSHKFLTMGIKPTPLNGYHGIFAAHIALHKLK